MAEQAARVVPVEDLHIYLQMADRTLLFLAFLQLGITVDALSIDSIILLSTLGALYLKVLVFLDKSEHLFTHNTVQRIGWVVIGTHWTHILANGLHLSHLLHRLLKPVFAFGTWIDVLTDS